MTTFTQTPERAADFTGAIGVNIHLGHPGYGPATILSEMTYLGLSAVRQHAIGPDSPPSQVASFGQLAAGGLKFDWLTGGDLTPTLKDLDAFLTAHPGAVSTIEGPNEVNNFPFRYDGLTGTAAAIAYQKTLYSRVKADPLTASIPVLDFTDSPLPATAPCDAANIHFYPRGGREPMSLLAAAEASVQSLMPGKPLYVTEAGYDSLPAQGVDPGTQAKLTLNLLMDAAKLGLSATYLYDLTDDGADPTGANAGDHFGLFTADGQAKPAAAALHNLTSVLSDPGAAANGFAPSSLSYALNGMPASGKSLAIENSSGVYDVVLWAEPSIWDPLSHTPIPAPTESVTVSFAAKFAQVSVYDPMKASSPLSTASDAGAVTVGLSDHPLVIQVSNFVQALAGFAQPSSSGLGAGIPPQTDANVPSLLSSRRGS
ncbi:MAG: hypothetical protein JOZ00_10915 [Mycobacterium sp.]|uniref:hypothetical protein n=1 Tax=Mycobacterium sp. TaxID=1785 RepID=UPI001ED2966D|nr:hypothetical protein [Mycobacterium sp.]MBV8787188.1 hypothetical protein [Mycobacterium sp.]